MKKIIDIPNEILQELKILAVKRRDKPRTGRGIELYIPEYFRGNKNL